MDRGADSIVNKAVTFTKYFCDKFHCMEAGGVIVGTYESPSLRLGSVRRTA